MCNNFDYINFSGSEMARTLRLQTICERRDYFLCIIMPKCIHGITPHYLFNDVTMYVDINGYDTRSAENMDLYLQRCSREIYEAVFTTKAFPCGIRYRHAWRNLYRWLISNVITNFYMVEDFLSFWLLCVHVLYFIWNLVLLATYNVRISISHIYSYPALVLISYFMWGSCIF